MLSIGTMSAGKGFYYTDLAREQYYLEGGEPPGRWLGKAAKAIGLIGEVEKDELHELLKGFGPDEQKLVQNAGKENRQAGLDLTFSADKSVSVLWALADQGTRCVIERAQAEAVNSALQYLEQEAAWTRRGQGGEDFERCQLVFAQFLHSTSRAGDPNLHMHVLVPNVGLRTDGTTSALWNKELYLHKMAAGAIYRVALAFELGSGGLGYAIDSDAKKGTFRLRDVPEKLCEHFSKRRAQIELELQEHGYSSSKAADRANQNTREVKGHAAQSELFPRWEKEAREFGVAPETLPGIVPRDTERPTPPLSRLALAEAERLAREKATFRPQDLVRALANIAQDGLASAPALLRATREALGSPEVATVAQGKRHPLLTTKTQIRSEENILKLAASLDATRGLTVTENPALVETLPADRALDTKERRDALDYLTKEPGNLKLLAGVAGTGKTSLLAVARSAWEREGYRVVGMALSGKAARELQHGSGIETETVRKRQLQLDPTTKEQANYHGKQLLRAALWGRAKGYRDAPFERLELDSKTVVVIDECSMLGVEDTTQMLSYARTSGAKVVMVGDERQLPAIDDVSPFEAIGKHVGRFELTYIKRQQQPWMRDAVQAFANGDTPTGLSLLREHRCLHMGDGGPETTKGKLVSEWMKAAGAVRDKLILTATNEDARSLNKLAQDARHQAGELGSIITVNLGSGEVARRNDRILLGQNNRRLDVRNGETGTILKIHRPVDANPFSKGEVTVELDHGQRVRLNLNRYKDTSLGYALTTHKAQGSTVDQAFVYTTPQHAARDMVYVQTSRAREGLSVYCPGHDLGEDLSELERSLQHDSADNQLALAKERELRGAAALEEQERQRRSRDMEFGR